MPEKTCSTCQCNKVCDHNKYGFENCGNYISADVVPRAEERWAKNLEMLKSGALGDDTLHETLLRYWKTQEEADYPYASENVKYFEDIVRKKARTNME